MGVRIRPIQPPRRANARPLRARPCLPKTRLTRLTPRPRPAIILRPSHRPAVETPSTTPTPYVAGFHGTSDSAASAILAEGFKVSSNDHDWLGDGAYFFQDAPSRALEWARRLYPGNATVLEARICLSNCMDLLDINWHATLADAHDQFVRLSKSSGVPLPLQSNGAHRLDREVINYIAGVLNDAGTPIRSVRGVFAEGKAAFPNSAIRDLSHVQIAVRDVSAICHVRLFPQSLTGGVK